MSKKFSNPFDRWEMPEAVMDGLESRHTVPQYSFIVLMDGKPVAKCIYQIPKGGFRSGMEKAWTYFSVRTPDDRWLSAYVGEGGCGYDKAAAGMNHAANAIGIPRPEKERYCHMSRHSIVEYIADWHGVDRTNLEIVDLW